MNQMNNPQIDNPQQAARPTTWQGILDTFDGSRLGEFFPEEFELLQEQVCIELAGRHPPALCLSLSCASLARSQGRLGSQSGEPVLIAYASRYYSGMPFEDPVLASLREFVPNSHDQMLGVRELIVLSHLCNGFPPRDQRWKVASAYPDKKKDPPVMRLLGYFVAGSTLPGATSNSIWIVQQWDGFAPLEGYKAAQQTSGFGLGRLFGAEQRAVNDRQQMIKAIARGMLEAVAFLHDASVAHGALSQAVFRVSTFDDKDWARVAVKVDGLGVATYGGRMPAALTSIFDGNFSERVRMDRQRLALLILELVVTSLSVSDETGSTRREFTPTTDLGRLEQLLMVYDGDISLLRSYLEEERAYGGAVDYMDRTALWDVIDLLAEGQMDVGNVLGHSFFRTSENE